MLGGGGFTGGVYEIGALRALDLLSVNQTVNEFDVYVGTSAGSFVAAAVANGVTPEEMMRVIVQQVPTPFPDARVELAAEAQLQGVRDPGGDVPAAAGQPAAHPGAATWARSRRSTSSWRWPRRCPPACTQARESSATCAGSCLTRTGPTTSASWPASSTWPPPIWTPVSGSCSGPRASTTCRSPRPSAPPAPCR